MYKSASRNMQRRRGISVCRPISARDPRSKNAIRKFFYLVVLHNYKTDKPLGELQRVPTWLQAEVVQLSAVAWLERWANIISLHQVKLVRQPKITRPHPHRPIKKKK